jgi:hypothetical protein
MRREPEFFGDQDLSLVYIAKRLRDALGLETLLTTAGVDYLVEADHYQGGVVFRSQRVGAFFYVPPATLEATRQVLRDHGYRLLEPE